MGITSSLGAKNSGYCSYCNLKTSLYVSLNSLKISAKPMVVYPSELTVLKFSIGIVVTWSDFLKNRLSLERLLPRTTIVRSSSKSTQTVVCCLFPAHMPRIKKLKKKIFLH